jgi:hypothetical protein
LTGGAPHVALAPATRRDPVDAQLLGDLQVLQALRGQQNNARTLGQSNAGRLRMRQPDQLSLLLLTQLDRRGNSHFLAPTLSVVDHWSRVVQLSCFNNQTLH